MFFTLPTLWLVAHFAGATSPGDERRALVMDFGARAWLGVGIADVDREARDKHKLPEERGVLITDVEKDSPAERAGLKEDDVLWSFRGEPLHSAAELRRLVEETPPGREVRLEFYRSGALQSARVSFEERRGRSAFHFRIPDFELALPRHLDRLRAPDRFEIAPQRRLGVSVISLTDQLAEHLGAKEGGVLVTEVEAGSSAETAGLKAGDVLVRANGKRLGDPDDLRAELAEADAEVTIDVVRERKPLTLKARVEPRASGRRRL